MGCSNAMIASTTVNGRPLTEAKAKKASDGWPGYKSKWESLYAVELGYQLAAGEISEWAYEPVTFRLTDGSVVDGRKVRAITYTPDFVVWLPSGQRRNIEIKGKWRQTKDVNRFKLAKDKFRQEEFVMLKYTDGVWERLPY
jgi:hypothetical protein